MNLETCDAVARAILRHGIDALTLEHIADEAETTVDALGYDDVRAATRECILNAFVAGLDDVELGVSKAADGADAMSRYLDCAFRFFSEHFALFRVTNLLRQCVGAEKFGLTQADFRDIILPRQRRSLDGLEAKLTADRGPSELAGGIHPRRLAFLAQVTSVGILTLKGMSIDSGEGMLHTDDLLLREAAMALGASTTTLRQMGALNDVSKRLAKMRSEAELRTAIGELLTSALDFDEAASWRVADGKLLGTGPPVVDRALLEGVSVDEGDDGNTNVAVVVRFEGEVDSVVLATMRATKRGRIVRKLGERDVARVETFAAMVGLALENVCLYENLQAKVDARTRSLRDAQAALVQSERLAATGNLVAGLAHELNTPIASVLASQATLASAVAKLSLDDGRLSQVIGDASNNVKRGCDRIGDILDKLKRFSRLDGSEVADLDVAVALDDAVSLMRSKLPADVGVDVQLERLPKLRCKPAQLNQVFLNVLQNAAEAVASGQVIRVRARHDAGVIVVGIIDEGSGIEADVVPHIFEPGFTTKGVGVGSGLGLSIAQQVVNDHGGNIEVDSEPARGTTVTIRLPVPHQ
jgi:signal transduction histidine kinase